MDRRPAGLSGTPPRAPRWLALLLLALAGLALLLTSAVASGGPLPIGAALFLLVLLLWVGFVTFAQHAATRRRGSGGGPRPDFFRRGATRPWFRHRR